MEQKSIVVDTLKIRIIQALGATNREGIANLVAWLEANDFFTSPASTKFHGAYKGGLSHHSYNVYTALSMYDRMLKLETPRESLIIAGLLHDVCKIGAYIGDAKPYQWNPNHPKGHATLSIARIRQFIELTDLEEKMILYHMGIYGLVEFQDPGKEHRGEYTLRNKGMANAWYHHPIVKVMYFCDELATLEEKAEEHESNK